MLPSLSAQTMNEDPPILIYASSAPIGESERLHEVRAAILRATRRARSWPSGRCRCRTARTVIVRRRSASSPTIRSRSTSRTRASGSGSIRVVSDDRTVRHVARGLVHRTARRGVHRRRRHGRAAVEPVERVPRHRVVRRVGPDRAGRRPNGSWSAIDLVGERPDGALHVEVVRHEIGTEWVVGAARKGTAKYGPLVVDPTDSARLIERLVAARCAAAGDVDGGRGPGVGRVPGRRPQLPDPSPRPARAQRRRRRRRHPAGGESWVFSAKASTVDVTTLLPPCSPPAPLGRPKKSKTMHTRGARRHRDEPEGGCMIERSPGGGSSSCTAA